jgi:hypothetical protein
VLLGELLYKTGFAVGWFAHDHGIGVWSDTGKGHGFDEEGWLCLSHDILSNMTRARRTLPFLKKCEVSAGKWARPVRGTGENGPDEL